MAALAAYKTYLQKQLLPKAKGSFAIGAETYAKTLSANEMIDMPLDELLKIAEADRQRNEAAFQAAARTIDATKPPERVLAALQNDHPSAAALLKSSQDTLNSIRQFIVDRQIITIPPSIRRPSRKRRRSAIDDVRVDGHARSVRGGQLEAFYFMTLPDPRATTAAQEEFLKSWYYAAIANVSVHEVYPGHYTAVSLRRDVSVGRPEGVRRRDKRRGLGALHGAMMIDEGFHAGDPGYRLAQLQDALLRDVRFIVGIKLHTQRMTIERRRSCSKRRATSRIQSQCSKPGAAQAIRCTGTTRWAS